ncbi:MAG: tRNA pseudouridine(55) synthase TruB, partial [Clostridia bacterium]|nr:tRNA pseudouridine(55) synthase TruB [Clostridia bacterium]
GVSPVLFGRAVKASESLLCSEKHYEAELTLGITTDTGDTTGKILSESEKAVSEKEVKEVCTSFLGESLQTPPMYSALKVCGRKLCDLARAGMEVEREPRPIVISKLEAEKKNDRVYRLEVVCSKGTYIRVLCEDIGRKLGTGGTMSALVRLSAAGFSLTDCRTLSQWEEMSETERQAAVIPTEDLFRSWKKVVLPPFFARLAKNGLPIYQKKIGTRVPLGEYVTFYDGDGFFALAVSVMAEEGKALKPFRRF